MKIKSIIVVALFLSTGILFTADSMGDELFIASGRKLSNTQRDYIQDRVKWLRDSDYSRRFDAIRYLVSLGRTAIPFLTEQVERGSNPTPVRCAMLALSEINAPEAAPLLGRMASDKRSSDDELIIAALGLGKLDAAVDLELLRELIQPGERRQVRKAAALALARRMDSDAPAALIKLARAEREDELASLFMLCAAMIGGEDVVKAMPRLFKSADLDRRRALILGSAFLSDPVLLPTLIKFTRKDKHLADLLCVSLGRFPSTEAAAYLRQTVSGSNPALAIDALYASMGQAEEEAWKCIEAALNPARSAQVRAHALLAMIDRGCTLRFLEPILRSMKDKHAEVRSAAVLAFLQTASPDAAERLTEALEKEKQPAVIHDLLISLGLTRGVQMLDAIERWARPSKRNKTSSWKLQSTAQTVLNVIEGKTDPRVLTERYEQRLTQLSVGWEDRFRARVMNEIYKWMGLDRIIRKSPDASNDFADTSYTDPSESSGESEESDDEGNPESGGVDGTDTSEDSGSSQSASGEDTSGNSTDDQKKFLFRREVVEWDLLMWFTHYPYFPEELFAANR